MTLGTLQTFNFNFMHEPLYRQALRASWDLTWHHKRLWIFGLFAAFLGQLGILELLTKVGMAASTYALYPTWLAAPGLVHNLFAGGHYSLSVVGWVWLIWLLFIFLGLVLLLIFTAVCSQGALIRAAGQFVKKGHLPHLGNAWKSGIKHFWRLLFINIFKKLIFVVLAVVVGWGTLAAINQPSVADLFLFLILFILATGVGIMVSFWLIYTAGYIVIEDYSLGKALRASWKLFLDHWLVSMEIALVVILLNLVLGLVAIFGLFICLLPSIVLWFFAAYTLSSTLWLVGVVVAFLFFALLIVFLGSIFSTFTTTVWTYLFMKMHHQGIKSRIVHILTWKNE